LPQMFQDYGNLGVCSPLQINQNASRGQE